MKSLNSSSRTGIGMLVLCGLLSLIFAGAGLVKFVPIQFEVRNFAHFGYAPWFMTTIGIVEVVGAVLLLPRPTRAHGALLLAGVMVGAATSHLHAGDGLAMATPALVLFALLMVVVAAHRTALGDSLQVASLRRTS